jgi:hypothetical protein
MDIKPGQTLMQAQAKTGVILCPIVMLTIYFFEYAGVDINKRGEGVDVDGSVPR